jgi:hypothetical protein
MDIKFGNWQRHGIVLAFWLHRGKRNQANRSRRLAQDYVNSYYDTVEWIVRPAEGAAGSVREDACGRGREDSLPVE